MALRSAVHENEQKHEEEHQQASAFRIKNTFIDFCAPHNNDPCVTTSRRRSISAPPAPRGGSDADTEDVAEKGEPGTWSAACTSAGEDMSGDEWRACDDEESLSFGSGGQGSPRERLEASDHKAGGCIELDLNSLLSGPGSQATPAGKIPLRSAARAWTPGGMSAMRATVALPPSIHCEFTEVVSAGRLALEESVNDVRVEMVEASGGSALVAHVCPHELNLGQHALLLAQEAMLAAAAKSDKVYIVGYETQPFVPVQGNGYGFTAQLAKVRDEDAACWDLLTAGVCCRGRQCRWQHPSWQAPIQLSLELDWPP